MAEYEAGTAYLQVVPSYRGVVESITANAKKWGVTAGREFADSFNSTVMARTGRAPLGPSAPESSRRGGESGGRFAEAWKARVTAALRSLPDVKVDANTADADAKLFELKTQIEDLARQRVGIDMDEKTALAKLHDLQAQLDKLAGSSPSVRVKVDTRAASAELAKLRAEIEATTGAKDAKNAEKQAGGLMTALITLGPALVPFAGGVAATAGGLAAMGAAGVLAVKGIEAEMKSGTVVGAEYRRGLNLIKTDMTGLEQTAARGLLSGFQQSIRSVNAQMPEFNTLIGRVSQELGGIGSKGLSGLVGGFTTFEPDIQRVLHLADQLAGRFEAWATGPGGAKFAQSLGTDLDHLVPAVSNLVTLASHLVAALNPSGLAAIDLLSQFSGVLDVIPVDVLKGLTTAFIAFRVATAVTDGIKAASVSLREFAAAEDTAAASSGALTGAQGLRGMADGAGLLLARIAPVAAGVVAAGYALDQLSNATDSWAQSGNSALQTVGTFTHALKDLATLHWNFASTFAFGNAAGQFDDLRTSALASADAVVAFQRKYGGATNEIAAVSSKYAHAVQTAAQATDELILKQATQKGQLSTAPTAFNTYIKSLQTAIDAEKKWTASGSGAVKTIDGTRYSVQAWTDALSQANGDVVKAEGILKGHSLALNVDQAAMRAAQAQQKALTDAYAAAESRLKLTDAQVDLYASTLGITAEQLANGTLTSEQFVAAIKSVKGVVDNGNTAMQGWVAAIAQWNQSGKTAADRANLLASAMVALNGDALGYANTMVGAAQANQQLVSDMNSQARATINLKRGTIDYHNAAAAPLLRDLQSLQTAAMNAAAATYQHENATKGAKIAARDAASVYYNDTRNALINEAGQLGLTRQQAKNLADTYFHWPKNAKTTIEQLNGKSVQDLLGKILQDLDRMVGKPWTAHIGANTKKARSEISDFVNWTNTQISYLNGKVSTVGGSGGGLGSLLDPRKAAPKGNADGGMFHGVGGPRDDANWVRISNREYIVNAAQTAKYLPLLNAINFGAPGFETGGFTGVIGAGGTSSSGGSSHAPHQVIVLGGSRISPSGSFGTAGHVLFGSGNQIGAELITALHVVGQKLITATTSVVASIKAVASGATRSVAAQVAAAVAPGVTSIAGLRGRLGGDLSSATTAAEHAAIARQNLLVLERHAAVLGKDAAALQKQADAMKSSTTAEKAAKTAAEAHAKAAKQVADAAAAMASKGKAAYDKLKTAADQATQRAKDDAQALVQAVQQQFQTLQQTITDFESGISGGLTAGSDLASVWGTLTDNVNQAKQALDSAQQAVDQAMPDTAAVAKAQAAQAAASAALASAHQQLQQAQSAGDRQAVIAAQNAQTAAVANLAAANDQLTQAQQNLAQQAGPTADQLKALTDAQTAYNQAVQAASASGVASVLQQFAASEAQFSEDLNQLKSMGAGKDLISQLAAMGAAGGDALAQGLIQDPAALASIDESMGQIQKIADSEGEQLAQGFYGSGVNSMIQLLQGIEKQFPELVKALQPYIDQLTGMFTIHGQVTLPDGSVIGGVPASGGSAASGHGGGSTTTGKPVPKSKSSFTTSAQISDYYLAHDTATGKWYDVNPTKGTAHLLTAAQLAADKAAGAAIKNVTKIPKFAAGVANFAGGLAYVHQNEMLANLAPGTSVIPENVQKSIAALYPRISPAQVLPGGAFAHLAAALGDMNVQVFIGDEAIDPRMVRVVNTTMDKRFRAAQHVKGDALTAVMSPHARAAARG